MRECRAAMDEDGAEAIVLGCAGMADLCASLRGELGIPVIDGVAAAVAAVEGLLRLGPTTTRRSEYAAPPPKPYSGALADFAL